MVPSSSGLGRGPLKAKTRVQISLGPPIIKKLAFRRAFLLFSVSPRVELAESSGKQAKTSFYKRSLSRGGARRTRPAASFYFLHLKRECLNLVPIIKKLAFRRAFLLFSMSPRVELVESSLTH